jgi:hypothetical protein
VPLAGDALALIEGLPRFTSGSFLFTTTGEAKPVNGFSKAKARIDKLSGYKDWKLHHAHASARPARLGSGSQAGDRAREAGVAQDLDRDWLRARQAAPARAPRACRQGASAALNTPYPKDAGPTNYITSGAAATTVA